MRGGKMAMQLFVQILWLLVLCWKLPNHFMVFCWWLYASRSVAFCRFCWIVCCHRAKTSETRTLRLCVVSCWPASLRVIIVRMLRLCWLLRSSRLFRGHLLCRRVLRNTAASKLSLESLERLSRHALSPAKYRTRLFYFFCISDYRL